MSWSAPVCAGAGKVLASLLWPLRRRCCARSRRYSRRAHLRGADLLCGRSGLSSARAAVARAIRGDGVGRCARRSPRRSPPGNNTMVADAARPRAQLVGRAGRCGQPDARNRLGPYATGARAGSHCDRCGVARGRGERRRRLGNRIRSRARPRFANSRLRRERSWRRASRQPRRLRCSLGARYFRQVSARHRSGTVRRGRGGCRPQCRAGFAHCRRRAGLSRSARAADAACRAAQGYRGGAQICRLRAGALQPRHHQRARRYVGPARNRAIAGASGSADRAH